MRGGRRHATVVVAILVAYALPTFAQAPPCAVCAKGDALIAHYRLEPLRAIAQQLAAVSVGDPLTQQQYAQLVGMRNQTPALATVGALDDADLTAVAASLCGVATGACVDATSRALRCASDRCPVALPNPDPAHDDVLEISTPCRTYSSHNRSPAYGLGIDWGYGVQRTRYPSDGGAWSFGIQGRLRIARRFGAVGRVDRIAGRDEATDADNNGKDDFSTGSITRVTMLAGPSILLDSTRWETTMRSLRLDLLGGWMATRSQANESGPAAGADLAFQLTLLRFGVRIVQGFGDARTATIVLAHFDVLAGSAPLRDDSTGCASTPVRRSRFALGISFPLGGAGVGNELGYLATGYSIEPIWHLTPSFDLVTRTDLLVFPGDNRDRVVHQAVLGGLRMDHGGGHHSEKVGFFTTLLGGYTHSAGLTPTTTGSGPIVDISFGWGGQDTEGAAYLRLHGRFGLGSEDRDYRALFLAGGFELRFDPKSWANRFN